jgi:thioredoxin 1
MATNATTGTFEGEVIKTDSKVIVDFWAEWCGRAAVHRFSTGSRMSDVKLVQVNIDEQRSSRRYGVASIPFMVLFENGEPRASAIGAMPKGSLEKALGLTTVEA